MDSCATAASCFDTTVAGVDLLFEPGFRRHHVLEVNAFGDFFPGWTDAAGRNLHEIELTTLVSRCG
jgi:glutathione synthase/RimK-type ligase-like ATP-grasp enzyme